MKKFLFVDMDGTLAVWKPATPEELAQPHYFAMLPVNGNVVKALRLLRDEHDDQDVEIYILSAVLPETKAEEDKKVWLSKHCPYIDSDHQIFVPYGENKAEYVKQMLGVDMKACYLLDDYSKNVKEWAASPLNCSTVSTEKVFGILVHTPVRGSVPNRCTEILPLLCKSCQTNSCWPVLNNCWMRMSRISKTEPIILMKATLRGITMRW